MPRGKIGRARPDSKAIDVEIARLRELDVAALRARWHTVFGRRSPSRKTISSTVLTVWRFAAARAREKNDRPALSALRDSDRAGTPLSRGREIDTDQGGTCSPRIIYTKAKVTAATVCMQFGT